MRNILTDVCEFLKIPSSNKLAHDEAYIVWYEFMIWILLEYKFMPDHISELFFNTVICPYKFKDAALCDAGVAIHDLIAFENVVDKIIKKRPSTAHKKLKTKLQSLLQ